MLQKPSPCTGCALEKLGTGYAPAVGPVGAPIALIAEALGGREAMDGIPMQGEAGMVLTRVLKYVGTDRAQFRIDNVLRCRPPNDWLDGSPWELKALEHCTYHLETLGEAGRRVVVPLGGTATRRVLQLSKDKFKIQNFHGTIQRDPLDRFWVVPSWHPSFINRGAWNLFGVVQWDMLRALDLSRRPESWRPNQPRLYDQPPVEWVRAWAEGVKATVLAGGQPWGAVDIETPDKEAQTDEGELTATKDRSYEITHINLCTNPDEAWSVEWVEPYRSILLEVFALAGPVWWFWHAQYDMPRLLHDGVRFGGRVLDGMWAAKLLQSDVPRGLGFWAPFYSDLPAWKHKVHTDGAYYRPMDALQTMRIAHGVSRDLVQQGQWETFWRHVVLHDAYVIQPACDVGLLVDQEELPKFAAALAEKETRFRAELQETAPEAVAKPIGDWKTNPGPEKEVVLRPASKATGRAAVKATLPTFSRQVGVEMLLTCTGCGQAKVKPTHRCKGLKKKDPQPTIEDREHPVLRWFVQPPFNPGSPPQLLECIKAWGYKPGKNKHTGAPSADKQTLLDIVKGAKTQDPHRLFFRRVLDWRQVSKVKSTYVDGTFRKLEQDRALGIMDGRLHPTIGYKPSTQRMNSTNPNIHNVVADKGGKEGLAAGFKRVVIAGPPSWTVDPEPDCWLVEADFSAIEAVLVGWRAQDPDYIRRARLGVHAHLASVVLGKPPDESWSEADKAAYYAELKEKEPQVYDQAKRCVHGTNYGLTPYGMVDRFPEIFPDRKTAERVQAMYFEMAPKLKAWHQHLLEFAGKHHYLGGAALPTSPPGHQPHPFAYKHWFWNVIQYRQINHSTVTWRKKAGLPWAEVSGRYFALDLGDDAKRAIAFDPQSIAAGVIKEANLRLFHPDSPSYIGAEYYGRTPLRAVIHDSDLLEVPKRRLDHVLERVVTEMSRPVVQLPCPPEWGLGEYLAIGVGVKAGKNWAQMEKVKLPPELSRLAAGKASESDVVLDLDSLTDWEELEDDWETAAA